MKHQYISTIKNLARQDQLNIPQAIMDLIYLEKLASDEEEFYMLRGLQVFLEAMMEYKDQEVFPSEEIDESDIYFMFNGAESLEHFMEVFETPESSAYRNFLRNIKIKYEQSMQQNNKWTHLPFQQDDPSSHRG
ncbi:MAG: hypothetical protein ACFBSC_05085 [Microcoleaceae cyanobacterium]